MVAVTAWLFQFLRRWWRGTRAYNAWRIISAPARSATSTRKGNEASPVGNGGDARAESACRTALRDLLDTMERGDEYLAFDRMQAAREALNG